ncbi:MAG: thioredoxin family protein [Flavobacteriia bacterium]|nr:thioredoxin family protein [Flavobacteriia bacterium]
MVLKLKFSLVLFIIFIILIKPQILFSQFEYEKSLDETFNKAKNTNKLVFIKYYSENCSHCKQLQTVLETDSVKTFYQQNFICYRIEFEHASKDDLDFLKKNKLYFENVPYLLFFDSNRQFLHYGNPKQESSAVIKTGKTALDPFERTSNLKNRYQSGERELTMLKRYSKWAQIQKDTSVSNKLGNDIFDLFPKSELNSKQSFIILANYVTSINNGFFKFWIENWAELDKIEFDKTVDKKKVFHELIMNEINYNKKKWSINDYSKIRKYIEISGLSSNPYSFFWEEESSKLVQFGKEKEALELAFKLMSLDSLKPHNLVYQISYFSHLFTEKENLEKLRKNLIQIQKRIEIPELKAELYIYHYRIAKKLGEKKIVEEIIKEGENYYSKNNIDNSSWKEAIKQQ